MARNELSILVPEWSMPQWKAIETGLNEQSIVLRIETVDSATITDHFAALLENNNLPDVVMLPTQTPGCKTPPVFGVVHEIANRLEKQGLVLLDTCHGPAFGVIPLWAYAWSLHTTNLKAGVEALLIAAGRYRDPKLPDSPVRRTSLLFHEQKYKLPDKLGGFEFSVHFPGASDLEIVTDRMNPNRGNIRILGIEGSLPSRALGFLNKLPWPKKFKLDPERDVFSMRLHDPEGEVPNGGRVDFQTGKTDTSHCPYA